MLVRTVRLLFSVAHRILRIRRYIALKLESSRRAHIGGTGSASHSHDQLKAIRDSKTTKYRETVEKELLAGIATKLIEQDTLASNAQ